MAGFESAPRAPGSAARRRFRRVRARSHRVADRPDRPDPEDQAQPLDPRDERLGPGAVADDRDRRQQQRAADRPGDRGAPERPPLVADPLGAGLRDRDRSRPAGEVVGEADVGPADETGPERQREPDVGRGQPVRGLGDRAPVQVDHGRRQQQQVADRQQQQDDRAGAWPAEDVAQGQAPGEQHPEGDLADGDQRDEHPPTAWRPSGPVPSAGGLKRGPPNGGAGAPAGATEGRTAAPPARGADRSRPARPIRRARRGTPSRAAPPSILAPMLVAIDGPVGAGKSTVARAVAQRLGFTYLDTGAMYRCVALAAIEDEAADHVRDVAVLHIDFEGDRVLLDHSEVTEAIRAPEVSRRSSQVAADPHVREALVDRQRKLTERGDWVAEGRDIGTVVRPDAELKVFLTASDEERAARRAAQTGRGLEQELADLRERDLRDRTREASPLRRAEDAVELDTTGLAFEQVVERIAALVAEVRQAANRERT
ncbi:Cytidylate kinase [Patulibacter medicamentivorans]|uniref:Cytidylate kinase n=2 Tax=Patulibacter medicamentivorans TaxID=1097667 RepID=H0E2D4_9ACTN|nr:Cytidylate kinase [Patulibacter medicamentivorans]